MKTRRTPRKIQLRKWIAEECLRINIPEKESFEKKIRGKKVAVVIPSSSLLKNAQGKNIDNNYNTVIRIGHGYETDGLEDYLGTKTDAIYHGLRKGRGIKRLNLNLVESYGVKHICCLCSQSIFWRCKANERRAKKETFKLTLSIEILLKQPCGIFVKILKKPNPPSDPFKELRQSQI